MALIAFFLVLAQLAAAALPEFAERRTKIRKLIPDGVLVLFGNKESSDVHDSLYQQTDFYYFTGWEERKLGPDDPDARVATGFETVRAAERFERELRALLDVYSHLLP